MVSWSNLLKHNAMSGMKLPLKARAALRQTSSMFRKYQEKRHIYNKFHTYDKTFIARRLRAIQQRMRPQRRHCLNAIHFGIYIHQKMMIRASIIGADWLSIFFRTNQARNVTKKSFHNHIAYDGRSVDFRISAGSKIRFLTTNDGNGSDAPRPFDRILLQLCLAHAQEMRCSKYTCKARIDLDDSFPLHYLEKLYTSYEQLEHFNMTHHKFWQYMYFLIASKRATAARRRRV